MSGVSVGDPPPAAAEPGAFRKAVLAVITAFTKAVDYVKSLPWVQKVLPYLVKAWAFLVDFLSGMKDVFNALQLEFLGFKIQSLPFDKFKKLKAAPTIPKGEACVQCGQPAENFCVDCKDPGVCYCRFCACMLHHPSMKTEQHSIEEIQDPKKLTGVKLLSPILPELLFSVVVLFAVGVMGTLSEEHVMGASYCPTTNRIRKWLVYVDPNVFYYYKDAFAKNCNIEDSFWRTIVIDFWVRSIATGTDSMLLLLQSSVISTFFAVFVNFFFSRIVGFLYGCFAQLVHWLESTLPRGTEADPSIYVKLAGISQRISVSRWVKAPPLTYPRRRPQTDYIENLRYLYKRQLRVFKAYEKHAQGMMERLIWKTWQGMIVVRFLCIVIDLDIVIRLMLKLVGLGRWVESCRQRYMRMTGLGMYEDNLSYWSDWFVWGVVKRGVNLVRGEVQAAELLTGPLHGALATMWPLVRRVLFPALFILLIMIHFKRVLLEQRAQYKKKWPEVRQNIYGTAGKEPGVDWKSVTFSPAAPA